MKVELEHVLQNVSCTQAARQRGASAHRLIDEPGRARLTRPERSNSGHSSATLSNQPALASEITHLLDTCEICGLGVGGGSARLADEEAGLPRAGERARESQAAAHAWALRTAPRREPRDPLTVICRVLVVTTGSGLASPRSTPAICEVK